MVTAPRSARDGVRAVAPSHGACPGRHACDGQDRCPHPRGAMLAPATMAANAKEDGMAKTFGQMAAEAMAAVPAVTPAEAQRRREEDPTVLLVATLDLADRRRLGQPVGAAPISGGMIALRADREVPEEFRDPRLQDRDRPIITICGGGRPPPSPPRPCRRWASPTCRSWRAGQWRGERRDCRSSSRPTTSMTTRL